MNTNDNSTKIAVIGAGGFGLALAHMFAKKYNVSVWVHGIDNYKTLSKTRRSENYLHGIRLNKNIKFTMNMEEAINNKKIIIIATPSFGFRNACREINKYIKPEQIIVSATKGLDRETGDTMSEIARSILPSDIEVLSLSGPSHAEEIARDVPTALVVAGVAQSSEYVRDILMIPPTLRVYSAEDQIGVEVGGALKNIIAIAGGIVDGLKLGDNTKALLITRGLAEIVRFGIVKGAKPETFYGLTGMGDLIVTTQSKLSRNNRLGRSLAQGKKLENIMKRNKGQVAEGVHASKAVYEYAKTKTIEMPIMYTVYNILFNNENINQAIVGLMTREARSEIDRL